MNISMDILQGYDKNQSRPSQDVLQTQDQFLHQRSVSPDTGFFIRLVMKLSGGRIENARQASWVLLGVTVLVFIVSILFFLGIVGSGSNMKAFIPKGYTDLPH